MTVDELLVYGKQHVHKDHAKLLLASILNKNPLELLLYLEEEVPKEKVVLYKKEILALENNQPLQYVIGNVNFYGNEYSVNYKVLFSGFLTAVFVLNTI